MNEVLIACAVIAIVLLIAIVMHILEKRGDCRHIYGSWHAGETDDAYVQFRQCEKCGYTEREQWRKMK